MYHDINSFHASQMCPEWIEQQNNGLRQTKSLQSEIGLTRMNSNATRSQINSVPHNRNRCIIRPQMNLILNPDDQLNASQRLSEESHHIRTRRI